MFGGLEPRSSRVREREPILESGGRGSEPPIGVQGALPQWEIRGAKPPLKLKAL